MVGGSGLRLTDIKDAGRIAGTGALSGSVTHAAWWAIGDLLSPRDAGALRQVAFGEDINAAGDVLGSTDDNVNGTIRMQVSPAGGAPVAVGPTATCWPAGSATRARSWARTRTRPPPTG